MSSQARERIAVIGAGVSGIVAAYLLQEKYEVVLFEKNNYLGGHTNTIIIPIGPDAGTAVDTGFIVLNDRTYPLLHRFLEKLSVPVRFSDMSFSYHNEQTGFQYAGTNLNGLFAQRKNLLNKKFLKFLWELRRFCIEGELSLSNNNVKKITLGNYLLKYKYSKMFIDCYIIPMGSAIWSAPQSTMLEFPAESFLRFFKNHGLLSLKDRPRWQTVAGGSHTYIREFLTKFSGTVYTLSHVKKIVRGIEGINLLLENGYVEKFDYAVISTHADEALSLLENPSQDESVLLGAWKYQNNHMVLHTDSSVLPTSKRAWASWNYTKEIGDSCTEPVSVTYHMNRLQGLNTKDQYCVTLNRKNPIPKDKIIAEFNYSHPVFNLPAVESQLRLKELQGQQKTYFCGSYFGYGFHEDAVRSAVEVAKQFGIDF